MEDTDRDRARSAHRLTLCRENFDDYVVALTAKLRSNLDADRVLSGETLHPLLAFQDSNRDALTALNVPWVPVTGRNRHFCVKMAWLREQVSGKIVRFVFVTSRNNLADIFTKILDPDAHARLAKALLDPKVFSTWGE